MSKTETRRRGARLITRLVICALILAAGVAGMAALSAMKKPPAEASHEERPIRVEIKKARLEDVRVAISGFGEARPLDVVTLSPEVSGRIIETHPRLDAGEIIGKGETILKIDPTSYAAERDAARARLSQAENGVIRLEKQYAADRNRLATLRRNSDLARAEFRRLSDLYEKESVGTRTGVERAEQAYNAAADQMDQLERALAIYPVQIKENAAAADSARAALAAAAANLSRCRITAPFTGRVKSASAAVGQFAAPGQAVAVLADDSVLEIRVPIDSRDARQWLRFEDSDSTVVSHETAWFDRPAPVPCAIRWTEAPDAPPWMGLLDRVVAFDTGTRTLAVAVRVTAAAAKSGGGLPLVEGMFCSVTIPGRTLENVIRLPRWAVSFENTAYLARDGRLRTVPVSVARVEEETAFISDGIPPGADVIVTRLADPLENSLLEIVSETEDPS